MLRYLHGRKISPLVSLLLVPWIGACGDPAPGDTGFVTMGTGLSTASTAPPMTAGTSAGPEDTSSAGPDLTTTTDPTPTTGPGETTTGETTTGETTAPDPTTATNTTSTGEPSEYVMFADPLIDGTLGTPLGGSFGPEGWTVTARADRIFWEVPRIVEGSVAFTMKNVTLDNLPLNDHEVFAMYEGGYDIEHPIGYNPGFRNNAFKSMIRIYGVAEGGDRVGKQKIMWGMCPFGAPGYHDGTCPCSQPAGFFEEPFDGDVTWDGTPQRLKIAWADGVTHYYRNDVEVLSIDWAASGLSFGPDSLYVSLGNPRPQDVDTAGMPIGAVFSDLVLEGWTGPVTPTCAQ